jgi:hypothetical protein
MSDLSALTDRELLKLWDGEGLNSEGSEGSEGADIDDIGSLFERRDEILEELKERGLFPGNFMKQWENDTGAYPTIDDPEFLQKLLAKREFAESLQTTWKPENDPCGDTNAFEVTPVQRFAANLMSPRTPYMSALLFHGVGVGKTCAAVQIAEAWLGTYPRDKIFLVAPPTIQEGFYRTIFDITKLKLPGKKIVKETYEQYLKYLKNHGNNKDTCECKINFENIKSINQLITNINKCKDFLSKIINSNIIIKI